MSTNNKETLPDEPLDQDMGFGKESEIVDARERQRAAPTIITRKSEPIRIGIPVNSRLAEDCVPIADLLEFGPERNGVLTSSALQEAQFYPLRVRTIGQYINNMIIQLGILGDDTAVDMNLDKPSAPSSSRSEVVDFYPPGEPGRWILPARKVLTFWGLPLTRFSLLTRREDSEEQIKAVLQGACSGRIVTSYTSLTCKALFPKSDPWAGTVIEKSDGQNERLLRSMPDRFIAATDIVRSGATAAEFDLDDNMLMLSRTGLWRAIYWDERDKKVLDVAEQLRERLKPLLSTR